MQRNQINKASQIQLFNLKIDEPLASLNVTKQKITIERFKDLVTDFLIEKLLKQTEKNKRNKNYQNKRSHGITKVPINILIPFQTQSRIIQTTALALLQKYLEFQKTKINMKNDLETLTQKLIVFLQNIQETADAISFELDSQKDFPNYFVAKIIQEYIKKEEKKQRIYQLETISKNPNSKGKKFSKQQKQQLCPLENQNNQVQQTLLSSDKNRLAGYERLWRTRQNFQNFQKESTETREWKSSKSQLKDVVEKCNVFRHSEKIEKLRKQKLKLLYEGINIEQIFINTQKQLYQVNGTLKISEKKEDKEYLQFLKDWMIEISVAQKLFHAKINPKESFWAQRKSEFPSSNSKFQGSDERTSKK